MIFKITPQLNRLIKAAAIILLVLLIVRAIHEIGNIIIPPRLGFMFYIARNFFDVLMLFYLIAIVAYFGEKKSIVAAFMIYTSIDIIERLDTAFEDLLLQSLSGIGPVIIVVITVALLYLLLTCLFIRSKVIFAPVLFIVGVLFAMIVLKLSTSLILSYYNWRQVIGYIDALSILIPLAIFLLSNRVNRLLALQATPGS